MQKIKYIIIFTLILALGIITIQLTNYQSITTSLIKENNSNKIETNNLQETITLLEEQNEKLQNTIISLEEQLSVHKLKLNEPNYSLDNNNTNYTYTDLPPLDSEEVEVENQREIMPNMTIDEDEKKVTGFGFDYKQKF